jgi:hypothetical protein
MLIAAAWYQIFQNATTNDFTGDSGSKSSIAVVKTAEVLMEMSPGDTILYFCNNQYRSQL